MLLTPLPNRMFGAIDAVCDVAQRIIGRLKDGTAAGGPPPNRLASGHCSKRPSCRNLKRRHSFADNVFAQHRPKRRTSVAAPGIRCWAGPLELDVATHTGAVDDLAEKNWHVHHRVAGRKSRTGGRHKPWRAARHPGAPGYPRASARPPVWQAFLDRVRGPRRAPYSAGPNAAPRPE